MGRVTTRSDTVGLLLPITPFSSSIECRNRREKPWKSRAVWQNERKLRECVKIPRIYKSPLSQTSATGAILLIREFRHTLPQAMDLVLLAIKDGADGKAVCVVGAMNGIGAVFKIPPLSFINSEYQATGAGIFILCNGTLKSGCCYICY